MVILVVAAIGLLGTSLHTMIHPLQALLQIPTTKLMMLRHKVFMMKGLQSFKRQIKCLNASFKNLKLNTRRLKLSLKVCKRLLKQTLKAVLKLLDNFHCISNIFSSVFLLQYIKTRLFKPCLKEIINKFTPLFIFNSPGLGAFYFVILFLCNKH